MTRIKQFASEQLGIELTTFQTEVIRAWAIGEYINIPKASGATTVQKVIKAWVKYGLEQDG